MSSEGGESNFTAVHCQTSCAQVHSCRFGIWTHLCAQLVQQGLSIHSPTLLLTQSGTETSRIMPPRVCRAVMLTTSALSLIQKRPGRLLLKRDRQRHRQGDERRKAGLAGWVSDDERGREGTAHGSNHCSFLYHSFFYVSTCQSFLFFLYLIFPFLICSLSVLNVSLSLPFIIQYDWSVFFIQVKILLSKPGVGNFGLLQFTDYVQK